MRNSRPGFHLWVEVSRKDGFGLDVRNWAMAIFVIVQADPLLLG